MNHLTRLITFCLLTVAVVGLTMAGCEKKSTPTNGSGTSTTQYTDDDGDTGHGDDHAGGDADADHDHGDDDGDHGHGHDHGEEISLGTTTIGDMVIECAQGHGKVEPGKEGHIVVKLPYNDNGATIVRAWIGTEDRFMSEVGKGEYAASHDDYDIHAMAPAPLPEGAKWWIEIEKPDGTTIVGSIDFH